GSSPYLNFLNSETSQFSKPGPRTLLTPESLPMLPLAGAETHDVLMYARICRSPCGRLGLHVKTTRGPKSWLPVILRFRSALPIPVKVYERVSGAPTLKLESPDICQPPNTCRPTVLSKNEFGRANVGIS